ncbi:MAG TPA: DUF3014 domain-containing protein [Methylococcaceae bacterium]|nr:DUF3014 domain-containing protein [Methylococcaceae bacterium]
MIRLLVFLGLLCGGVFFVFMEQDESEKDHSEDIIAKSVPIPPIVEVKPVTPITKSEPESKPLVLEQKNTISDILSEEPVDEWIALEDMLEPVLIKPPVIALADSDDFIRAALIPLFHDFNGANLFGQENLLQRFVTLVNDIAQGDILFKHRFFLKPESSFPVLVSGDALILNPEGYHRFNKIVTTFTQVDVDAVMVFISEYKSLMQIVFEQFSHADDYTLDKMLLKSIDAVLAAPIVWEEIQLIKKLSRYQFANPNYEALSGVEKQMIRLGPANTSAVQEKLKLFRARLLELER